MHFEAILNVKLLSHFLKVNLIIVLTSSVNRMAVLILPFSVRRLSFHNTFIYYQYRLNPFNRLTIQGSHRFAIFPKTFSKKNNLLINNFQLCKIFMKFPPPPPRLTRFSMNVLDSLS